MIPSYQGGERASHGFQSQQAIANDLYAINIAEPIHGFPYFLSFSFMIFHTLQDFSWESDGRK